jgi:hypothetical protein
MLKIHNLQSLLLIAALTLSSCGIRPALMEYEDSNARFTPNQTGLLVLEWFENGPLYSYLQLEKVEGGETVYLKAYAGRNIMHPNTFYKPMGDYAKTDIRITHPMVYELPAGEYRLLRIMHQEPVAERTSAFMTSLEPGSFTIKNGEATYIGSFELFANRGIPLIKPDSLSMQSHDKSMDVESAFKAKSLHLHKVKFTSQVLSLREKP